MASVLISRQYMGSGVLVISINRPRVFNCVDGETAYKLEEAFVAFEEDKDAKVAVLCGEGGNFCSGADLAAVLKKEKRENVANPMNEDMSTTGPMGISRLSLSKPVIAAISGYCLAGGLELACWCDLRVVASDAQLGVKCRLRGVPLIDGGTVRLPPRIGMSHATDLILTGRTVDAQEAYRMGFANRIVVEKEGLNLLDAAVTLAREIASHPQTCLRNDRWSMKESAYVANWAQRRIGHVGSLNVRDGEAEAMQKEFELGLKSLSSGEYRAKLREFLGRGKL